jgi:hypothetical protein
MRFIGQTLGALLAIAAGQTAMAQDTIGAAIKVTPAAFSDVGEQSVTLAVGQEVTRNAFVRTDKGGDTTLKFIDETVLDIGPGSRVKLDRFVFDDKAGFSEAGLTMVKGAFRWSSGNSAKEAYDLRTPLATIGIRGTVLDILVETDATYITVVEGAITACSIESNNCLDADPTTGRIKVTRESAEIDAAPELKTDPPKNDPPTPRPPAKAKPKLKRAEKAAPARIKRVEAPAPKRKAARPAPKKQAVKRPKSRIVYVEEEEVYVERKRRRPSIDPFVVELGIGILSGQLGGGKKKRPKKRYPAPDTGGDYGSW